MEVTPYSLARRFLGLKERQPGHHPQIVAWLELVGQEGGDEVPWCGAFVNGIVWLLGLERPALPARARSWLTVGEPILINRAQPGWDLVILRRGAGPQPGPEVLSAQGHVGFMAGWNGAQNATHIKVLGGNQADSVSVANYPLDQVLGVRRL